MARRPQGLFWWLLGSSIVTASGPAFTGSAQAVPICFPSASGVPGEPGLPDWWAASPPAPADDPRWRGSLAVGHSADQAHFRALIQEVSASEHYLVLSWEVRVDPGFAGVGDVLHFGLYNDDTATPANAKGNLFKITRLAATTTTGGAFGTAWNASMKYRDSTTAGGWTNITSISPPIPNWLSADGRLDATCDGAAPPTCARWLVRLRIKLNPGGTSTATGASDPTAGAPVGTRFRMFWDLQVESSGLTIHHKWPAGPAPLPVVTDVDETSAPPSYPAIATWGDVQFGTSPPCFSGIALDGGQLDVVTSPATASPHFISVTGTNVLHARPSNGTGVAQGGGAIKTSFRVADWGSAVGDSPSWRPVPGCNAATGSGSVGIAGNWDLSCSWNGTGNLSAEEKCAYDPANFSGCSPMPAQRYQHQCILAELSAVTGPFLFTTSSAYRNFDFVHASQFQRDARIDIGGLAPLGGGAVQRDVYLYVETQNLPAVVIPPGGSGGSSGGDNRDDPNGRNDLGLSPALRKRLELPPGPVDQKTAARLQAMVSAGQLTFDDVKAVMPTYLVHAWHDTGRKTAGGATIIEAQPSFGYFVSHDGALTGWQHDLAGKGVTLTPVPNARNFYKLSVAEGGSAVVTTTITALEQQKPSPGLPWWLILLLFVALLIYRLVRRKKTP